LVVAALAAALAGAACDTPEGLTSPDPLVTTSTTELFAGTLPVGGTRFYSYTVSQPGTVYLTLASLASGNATSTTHVTLGVGTPAGTGCALQNSVTTSAALAAQLEHSSPSGIYCVNVADAGGLTSPMAFAIRIVHP
jgi:hypothetical protein